MTSPRQLVGRILRRIGVLPAVDDSGFPNLPPGPEAPGTAEVIARLGLVEHAEPVRSHDGWAPPTTVLVPGASPQILAWLGEVAPAVSFRNGWSADQAVGVDAIIGWASKEMVARAERLRWIQLDVAGLDGVRRIPEIERRGIIVTNLQKVAGPVIAEHAMALLFTLTRQLHRCRDAQRAGRWSAAPVGWSQLLELEGRTLFVAGFGGIGSSVARLGHQLGMRVWAVRRGEGAFPGWVERRGGFADLPQFAREADVVVNALPLTPETTRVFGHAVFDAMTPGALFVNVGRGATVDTDALVRAVAGGRIAGAALDVTEPEPLPRGHPLWSMPNVVLTPHLAVHSAASRDRGWIVMRENLRRYVAGDALLSVADLSRGY